MTADNPHYRQYEYVELEVMTAAGDPRAAKEKAERDQLTATLALAHRQYWWRKTTGEGHDSPHYQEPHE